MPPELFVAENVESAEARNATASVRWLIDNALAYTEMIRTIRRARQCIRISQLAFDADCLSYNEDGTATRLIDELVHANSRGVVVRIVLNESLLLNTATPLRRALDAMHASSIEVRGVSCFPQLLHAKLLIVDTEDAFVVGSPFVNGYWDDSAHAPSDDRRPARELGGRPLHDLTVHVQGSTCSTLIAFHDELWNEIAEGNDTGQSLEAAEEGDGLSVATTVPAGISQRRPAGCTEVLDAMLDGIARAEQLIYLEHQYLSSRRIVAAVAEALADEPTLRVVALLNQNPDVTAYRVWQRDRLAEYKLFGHPRVGLFSLWTRRVLADGQIAMNQVFIHSKVIVVDDQWATMGSANIDGVSLHSYGADFKSSLGERVFRHTRNIDLNLVLDGSNNPTAASSIKELRTALWAEHLGTRVNTAMIGKPALNAWRTAAQQNIADLRADRGTGRDGTIVLPFSAESYPAEQLTSLGVAGQRIDLKFNPGWLEVHCSPNWIRNMFE